MESRHRPCSYSIWGQPNTEISKFINAYKSAGSRIIKKEKLAKAQRRLSRMQGSKKHEDKSANYIKQLRKVNKIHRHIANQRLDNLHKISTEIANQYNVVCVESLNMKSMSNKVLVTAKPLLIMDTVCSCLCLNISYLIGISIS